MGERPSLTVSPGTILLLRALSFPLSDSAGSAWGRGEIAATARRLTATSTRWPLYLSPPRRVVDTRPRDRWTDGRWEGLR